MGKRYLILPFNQKCIITRGALLTGQIYLLIVVTLLTAGAATYKSSDEKTFALWSNISSGCLGAALGLIQGPAKEDQDKYL